MSRAGFATVYNKHDRIWSGPSTVPTFNADCSVGKVVMSLMKLRPESVCLICDDNGESYTNQQVLTWSIRIAQHFKKMRLEQDDVVGIMAANSVHQMSVVLACLLNCTPFHAINAFHEEETIAKLFEKTMPSVIFCDGSNYEKLLNASKNRKHKPIVYTLTEHLENVAKVNDLLEPTPTEMCYIPENLNGGADQTIAILCSSGTTGDPKPVCMSNYALLYDFSFIWPGEVTLSFSPLEWYTCVLNMLLSAMFGATRIITTKPYSPDYLLDLVEKYKVTILYASAPMLSQLVKHEAINERDLKSIRVFGVGGSIHNPQAMLDIRKYLSPRAMVSNSYGTTEFGGIAMNFNPAKPKSVGNVMPGVRVKIIDVNGLKLGPNEKGEICAHHGKSWNGYYGNPMESVKQRDALNWFFTGDVGYFDDEGYLHIVDRKKDALKYRGMAFMPYEIEQTIAELPGVVEVCVFGRPSDVDGDLATAAVVKLKNSELSEEEVVQYVTKKYKEQWKRLNGGCVLLDDLPKTQSGKVIRRATKELAMAQPIKEARFKFI